MIRLVTDSSADLPADLVDRHGISVVPLTIRFGADEYIDGQDLTPHEFWEKLRGSKSLPETSAPSAGAFRETFDRLAAGGADGAVCVCLSSEISATYQAAVLGAEQASLPVKVVDSRTATVAVALQVLAGAEAAEAGGDLDSVADAVIEARDKTTILAALDTLEFLKRGGRIGGAAAFLGGILDLKPFITLQDGVVAAAGRVRTRSKALAALTSKIAEVAPTVTAVAILHGSATDADEFEGAIRAVVPDVEPLVAELGPVVGTHTGPGTIGVAYMTT